MPTPDRCGLDRLILRTIEAQHEAARAEPEPPRWKQWDVEHWRLDREYNWRYSPTWFGDLTAAEAGRQRVLRAIRKLIDQGLLEGFRGDGGRLERVRVTVAGLAVLGDDAGPTFEDLEPLRAD